MARLEKGNLNHGSQTMDAARSGPLRVRLPTRVLGMTLNCLFVLKEESFREALRSHKPGASLRPPSFGGNPYGDALS